MIGHEAVLNKGKDRNPLSFGLDLNSTNSRELAIHRSKHKNEVNAKTVKTKRKREAH